MSLDQTAPEPDPLIAEMIAILRRSDWLCPEAKRLFEQAIETQRTGKLAPEWTQPKSNEP